MRGKRVQFHLFFHKIQDWICKCNLSFAAHTDCLTFVNQKLRNDWLIELGEGWSLSQLSRGRESDLLDRSIIPHNLESEINLREKKHSEETHKSTRTQHVNSTQALRAQLKARSQTEIPVPIAPPQY